MVKWLVCQLTVNPAAPVEIETARGKLTITDFDSSTGKSELHL